MHLNFKLSNFDSMHQYIEQLRKKPYHHKRRVALTASTVITSAIFLGWISVVLPSNTNQIVATSKEVKVTESTGELANTPIETLKRSTAQVYDSVKSLIETSASSVNLQEDYSNMKAQVETGQIKLAPASTIKP